MSAMRDYVTPQERVDVFPINNLKRNFILSELDNIFYDRNNLDDRQEKLEQALHYVKAKSK